MARAGIFGAALLMLVGCHAKVTGNLEVDGSKFQVTQCRSGQAFGFSGLVLGDKSGRSLRLMLKADGSASVAVFKPNANRGDALGDCATLALRSQNSRISNIRNVKGKATLTCSAMGHKIKGEVTFENCH